MKMEFEEFEKKIGVKPAKIEAKADKYSSASLRLEGRGLELLALSMQIATAVMEQTHTDVDSYCEMLKEGFNDKNDDSKTDEESKEKSKTITKEDFKKAFTKVLDNLMHDKDCDVAKIMIASLVFTKYTNEMCESLFGEGLKMEEMK